MCEDLFLEAPPYRVCQLRVKEFGFAQNPLALGKVRVINSHSLERLPVLL